jgi:hypothetical protein
LRVSENDEFAAFRLAVQISETIQEQAITGKQCGRHA